MRELDENHKVANTSVFVDDTSMHARGSDFQEVLGKLLPAMLAFKKKVGKLKLTLSRKAVIVTSEVKLTNLLIKKLSAHGLFFLKASNARDLGVAQAGGKYRPSQALHQRLRQSRNRVRKNSKLAKVSRASRKLYSGSAFAMATWGHQAAGIAETQMLALERDAIASTGITAAGRCRTIGLVVAYGVLGTPRARIVRETMREWFNILRMAGAHPHILNAIRCAWAKAKTALSLSASSINKVHGVMSNVIHMLNQAAGIPGHITAGRIPVVQYGWQRISNLHLTLWLLQSVSLFYAASLAEQQAIITAKVWKMG